MDPRSFITIFTRALHYSLSWARSTHPMGTGGSFHGDKAIGREADHSAPTSAEVKKIWICTSTLTYVIMAQWLIVQAKGTTLKFTPKSRCKDNIKVKFVAEMYQILQRKVTSVK
jgi:predicted secreted protein